MFVSDHDPTRLLLVGDLNKTMGLAVEMVRGSAASIAVGTADCNALENWRRTVGELVVVDVAVNLPDVIARLRGERAANQAMAAAVEELVGHSVDDVERALILQTLDRCRGNRTTAAAMLGISVRTIRNKLRLFLRDDFSPPAGLLRH
ncbi:MULTISPECIES: helix-turn-helix domain-containing protein [unclassified Sphingobium]|uniref:helix-turn-helix domain-containing protein n=1 Tax=unclassified Sphingobium TaxID=2611147 RepID=UPI0007F46ECA|nr:MULTISPECIES: helix-turn-helix domain-containing protein [unclassified Sphingobium]OAN52558.1 DNA-binding protein [Sphingobium sp. TCM1]WIW90879.1 helix-turn-helix domain-containing protein [Sphingobium sp. V4]